MKIIIDEYGTVKVLNDEGQLHSYNDLPAIIYPNPDSKVFTWSVTLEQIKEFVKLNQDKEVEMQWYQNNQLHRDDDKPAIVDRYGRQEWYQNNQLHRYNDLPAIDDPSNKTKFWCLNGKTHRDNDLPAYIYDDSKWGEKEWLQHGKRHRTNGPAVIYADGDVEYWHQDKKVDKEFIDNLESSNQ